MKKFQTLTDVRWLMRFVRRDVASFTARQYQILSVCGLTSDEQDYRVSGKSPLLANFVLCQNCMLIGYFTYLVNHVTGYTSQHIWCLSHARIKWKGCSRKGIRCKNGRWWKWVTDESRWSDPSDGWLDGRCVCLCYLPLHRKSPKDFFGTGSPRYFSPGKTTTKWLCECVCIYTHTSTLVDVLLNLQCFLLLYWLQLYWLFFCQNLCNQ